MACCRKWDPQAGGNYGKRRYVTKLRVEGSSSRMASKSTRCINVDNRWHRDLRVGLKRKLEKQEKAKNKYKLKSPEINTVASFRTSESQSYNTFVWADALFLSVLLPLPFYPSSYHISLSSFRWLLCIFPQEWACRRQTDGNILGPVMRSAGNSRLSFTGPGNNLQLRLWCKPKWCIFLIVSLNKHNQIKTPTVLTCNPQASYVPRLYRLNLVLACFWCLYQSALQVKNKCLPHGIPAILPVSHFPAC